MWINNNYELIEDIEDCFKIIEPTLGSEIVEYMRNIYEIGGAEYEVELENEIYATKEHYKKVLTEIRVESEKLSRLISEKELNRKEISNVAGKIGLITLKEGR